MFTVRPKKHIKVLKAAASTRPYWLLQVNIQMFTFECCFVCLIFFQLNNNCKNVTGAAIKTIIAGLLKKNKINRMCVRYSYFLLNGSEIFDLHQDHKTTGL